MFGLDSIWHWVVLLIVVVVCFGTGKLRNAGSDIGAAIGAFRKAIKEGGTDATMPKIEAAPEATPGARRPRDA
jgi:sec-independent protein translocase protein TatA